MRVLITGGTGVIGALTGRKLAARGHSVRLLDTRPDPAVVPGDGIEVVPGDVLSFGALGEAVRDADVVVHLAYSLGVATNQRPFDATTLNVQGSANVLEAARLLGAQRVLLASSVAVYGSDGMYRPEELPLREDAATHLAPGMPLYGAGKLYLERLAEIYRSTHGLLAAGLRPSPVYGPGGVRGVSGWLAGLVEKPARGEPVTIDRGDAAISLVYVDDVAEQLVALAELPAEAFGDRYFYNTGGDATTIRELAGMVGELVPGARIEVTADGEPDVAGLPSRVCGDALAELIGRPRRFGLERGLRAHVEAATAR